MPVSTFLPAMMRVPRWRTMIDPVLAISPSESLTPRYWGFESCKPVAVPADFVSAIDNVYYVYMSTIAQLLRRFKAQLPYVPYTVVVVAIISIVGVSSFALGWIARGANEHHTVQFSNTTIPVNTAGVHQSAVFVASENSDKFHYRWCAGAERIHADNKIFFTTREEARAAGYEAAENCPGLQKGESS